MKKFKLLVLALLGFALVSLVACKNDVESHDGTYDLKSVTANGSTVVLADVDASIAAIYDFYSELIVNGNNYTIGGVELDKATWEQAGTTVEFDGNKASVVLTSGGETVKYNYEKR